MDYLNILKQASEKAMEDFKKCIPTPVQWVSVDLSNKPLSKPSEVDLEGECGGAYITGLHGKSEFVSWCKKVGEEKIQKYISLSKGVYKGYDLYLKIPNYNGQSAEKKEAFARTFCSVLNANGISCGVRAYLS